MVSSDERPEQVLVEGIKLNLPAATVIPLGFIVSELIANAAKYGKGRIAISLQRNPECGYALSVSNDGPALPEGFDPDASKGLGMKIIQSFVRQIDGKLQVGRGDNGLGARFTVLFGSPASLSGSTLELGLTCFADLPRHHALAGSNDSEYRPALVAVNRNRTSSPPSCSCRKYCKISGWASPISKPFIAG